MMDPRQEPECQECVTGRYEYVGQARSPRGTLKSVFECGDCGHEESVT